MARRFTFRFETMLKIRRQREDQHRRIVADRLREIHQIDDQLGQLDHRLDETNHAMCLERGVGSIDVQQLIRSRHWLGQLQKNMLELQATRRGHEAKLAQERAVLAEASKQRQILEKLKERQHQQHRDEEARQEARDSDEMTVIRHAYQHREDGDPVHI